MSAIRFLTRFFSGVVRQFDYTVSRGLRQFGDFTGQAIVQVGKMFGVSAEVMAETVTTLARALELTLFAPLVRAAAPRRTLRQENLRRAVQALREAESLIQALDHGEQRSSTARAAVEIWLNDPG